VTSETEKADNSAGINDDNIVDIAAAARPQQSFDFLNNMDSLRIPPNQRDLIDGELVLTHVPTSKPNKATWIRVNPLPTMTMQAAIYEDKENRECFLITREYIPYLQGVVSLCEIVVYVTRQTWSASGR
jgi:hypothetical protein